MKQRQVLLFVLVLSLKFTTANAFLFGFLCNIPILGWFFQLLFPSLCETDKPSNPCDPNPCKNGGSCSSSDSSSYTCNCSGGYSGPNCENEPEDRCSGCSENASCTADGVCTCNDGFEGDGIICCDTAAGLTFQDGTCMPDIDRFVTATFIPGLQNFVEDDVAEELNGDLYEVKTNLTTIETGIVELSQGNLPIEELNCVINKDGETSSIVIRFSIDIDADSVSTMFPDGAVVEVDADVFGSCDLQPSVLDMDQPGVFENHTKFHPEEPQAHDGYLAIEQAFLLESGEVEVRGYPTTFFFLFEEGHIQFDLVEEGSNRQRQLVDIEHSDTKNFGGSNALLRAYVTAGLKLHVRFHSFKSDWGIFSGIELSILVDTELSGDFEFGLDFYSGTISNDDEFQLFEIPIPSLSIPRLSVLKKIGLKQPRVGAYFDVQFFWEYGLTFDIDWYMRQTYTATTGFKQFQVSAKGGWTGISFKIRKKIDKSAITKPLFEETLSTFYSSGFTVEFDGKTGIKPGIYVDLFGLLEVGAYQRTYANLKAIGTNGALAPPPEDSRGLVVLGECDSCHSIELGVDFVLENISVLFAGEFRLKIKGIGNIRESFSKGYTFPGEYRAEVLTACLIERKSMVPCGVGCCREGSFCIQGACRRCDPDCIADAECLVAENKAVCKCLDGLIEERSGNPASPTISCELPCGGSECGPNASCSSSSNDCECDTGYVELDTGDAYDVGCILPCNGRCGPNTRCLKSSNKCQCLFGFIGDAADPNVGCVESTCGSCGRNTICSSSSECQCLEGYIEENSGDASNPAKGCILPCGGSCGPNAECSSDSNECVCEEGYAQDPFQDFEGCFLSCHGAICGPNTFCSSVSQECECIEGYDTKEPGDVNLVELGCSRKCFFEGYEEDFVLCPPNSSCECYERLECDCPCLPGYVFDEGHWYWGHECILPCLGGCGPNAHCDEESRQCACDPNYIEVGPGDASDPAIGCDPSCRGTCGPNAYCYDHDNNICKCDDGFVEEDPGDAAYLDSGCVPGCGGSDCGPNAGCNYNKDECQCDEFYYNLNPNTGDAWDVNCVDRCVGKVCARGNCILPSGDCDCGDCGDGGTCNKATGNCECDAGWENDKDGEACSTHTECDKSRVCSPLYDSYGWYEWYCCPGLDEYTPFGLCSPVVIPLADCRLN